MEVGHDTGSVLCGLAYRVVGIASFGECERIDWGDVDVGSGRCGVAAEGGNSGCAAGYAGVGGGGY